MKQRRARGRRWTVGLVIGLLAVLLGVAGAAPRYDELKRVIDRNTGHAHMTRGMNMYTLIALRECVTDADIPVLTQLLGDRDHVTQMTAAGVLVDMGPPGRKALGKRQTRRSGAPSPTIRSPSGSGAASWGAPGRVPPHIDLKQRSTRSRDSLATDAW